MRLVSCKLSRGAPGEKVWGTCEFFEKAFPDVYRIQAETGSHSQDPEAFWRLDPTIQTPLDSEAVVRELNVGPKRCNICIGIDLGELRAEDFEEDGDGVGDGSSVQTEKILPSIEPPDHLPTDPGNLGIDRNTMLQELLADEEACQKKSPEKTPTRGKGKKAKAKKTKSTKPKPRKFHQTSAYGVDISYQNRNTEFQAKTATTTPSVGKEAGIAMESGIQNDWTNHDIEWTVVSRGGKKKLNHPKEEPRKSRYLKASKTLRGRKQKTKPYPVEDVDWEVPQPPELAKQGARADLEVEWEVS
jgi:hypothetical protein